MQRLLKILSRFYFSLLAKFKRHPHHFTQLICYYLEDQIQTRVREMYTYQRSDIQKMILNSHQKLTEVDPTMQVFVYVSKRPVFKDDCILFQDQTTCVHARNKVDSYWLIKNIYPQDIDVSFKETITSQ